jgi:hypothetical protein
VLEARDVAKKRKSGIILNVSSYPLPTLLPKKSNRRSMTLTFDINFDLVEDSGTSTKVWFYRGFRFPPPLDDGDRVEVIGKFGRISKEVFYASKIIDRGRERVYTGFRNRRIKESELKENKEVPDSSEST